MVLLAQEIDVTRRSKTPSRVPSEQDRLQAGATAAAGAAMIERLREIVGPNKTKLIASLTLDQVNLLAGDAIAAWTKKRSEQAAAAPDVFDIATMKPAPDPDLNDDLPEHLRA